MLRPPPLPFSRIEEHFPSQIQTAYCRARSLGKEMGDDNHLPLLILFLLLTLSLSSPPVTLPPSSPQPSASASVAAAAAALFVLGDSTTNCGDNTVLSAVLPPNLTSSCLDPRHRFLPDLIGNPTSPSLPLFLKFRLNFPPFSHFLQRIEWAYPQSLSFTAVTSPRKD